MTPKAKALRVIGGLALLGGAFALRVLGPSGEWQEAIALIAALGLVILAIRVMSWPGSEKTSPPDA